MIHCCFGSYIPWYIPMVWSFTCSCPRYFWYVRWHITFFVLNTCVGPRIYSLKVWFTLAYPEAYPQGVIYPSWNFALFRWYISWYIEPYEWREYPLEVAKDGTHCPAAAEQPASRSVVLAWMVTFLACWTASLVICCRLEGGGKEDRSRWSRDCWAAHTHKTFCAGHIRIYFQVGSDVEQQNGQA